MRALVNISAKGNLLKVSGFEHLTKIQNINHEINYG